MLYQAIVSGIRTGVAMIVGFVITWLIAHGWSIPDGVETQLNAALFILISAGYNALVNWLTLKVDRRFAYLLGIPKAPAYAPKGEK